MAAFEYDKEVDVIRYRNVYKGSPYNVYKGSPYSCGRARDFTEKEKRGILYYDHAAYAVQALVEQ